MSSQVSIAAKAQEKKSVTATLSNNIKWLRHNGAPKKEKNQSEYHNTCLYVGRLVAKRLAVSVTQEDLLASLIKMDSKKLMFAEEKSSII
jgi:hypothetical protein